MSSVPVRSTFLYSIVNQGHRSSGNLGYRLGLVGGLILLFTLFPSHAGNLFAATLPTLNTQSTSAANPDLTTACGLDVIMVLDESGSLLPYSASVRSSVHDLWNALAGTGSRLALVEFNLNARTPLGSSYIELTNDANGPLSPTGALTLYLDNNYVPSGFTNWDAAFAKAADINQTQGTADLVIFMTDDTPTVYTNQFGADVGGDPPRAVAEALESANLVKGQGSHIFVVGMGDVSLENRLIDIAGPDRFPDHALPFAQSDYSLTDYDQLASALRQIAFSLCGPSVTVTKYANSAQGPQLVDGQSFTGQVAVAQAGEAANAFTWIEPFSGPAAQVGTSQSATTTANGTAQWQWTPGTRQAPQPWESQFTLRETEHSGYYFDAAQCVRKRFDLSGNFTLTPFTLSSLPATFAVGPDDLITCNVYNEHLAVLVTKSANPTMVPEAGGDVTFTFDVTNLGTTPADLITLVDSVFGNLHGQGNCVADGSVTLAVDAHYQCAVTKRIAGNVGFPHTNTVTATLRAANGATISHSAGATVTFRDSPPSATVDRKATPSSLPEPGGAYTYEISIANNNVGEPLLITALTDTPFGAVTTPGATITATTCAVPQQLGRAGQPTAIYRCQFTALITGDPGLYTDTLTVVANDDDGTVASFRRAQSVTIANQPPDALLTTSLAPLAVNEPGGTFVLTATITNHSTIEPLTLTSLSTTLGELAAPQSVQSTCQLSQTIQAGERYQCTYRAEILQNSGLYTVAVNAGVADDDGALLSLSHVDEVEIANLPSSLLVTMHANQTTIAEPGGNLTFTVAVKNSSAVDAVTITEIVDDRFGDLAASCPQPIPFTLAPNETIHCQFVGAVAGAVGSVQTNMVWARGVDDDGIAVSDSDQESIEITDLPALLDVTQVAEPANIAEPGGPVTITTRIRNISPTDAVTIHKVETNDVTLVAGALAHRTLELIDISATCQPALPTTLAPGSELDCTFIKSIIGPIRSRHVSNVVISGADDENLPIEQTSRETIDIIDVPSSLRVTESLYPVSVPEAGAMVTFTVQVKNTSPIDTVIVDTLTSSRLENVTDLCGELLPATLLPGQSMSCQFSEFIAGDVNTLQQQQVAATATDDDGVALRDSTQRAIGVTDTPSSIRIVQLAEPSGVTEPGGTVTFTVAIRNTSLVDDVTITGVTENRQGDLRAGCVPTLPTTLAPGGELHCSYTDFVGGNAATVEERAVTVAAIDDDGVAVSDFDLLAVDVLDVPPIVGLSAVALPNQILETGEWVTMTVTLVNDGPELVTVTTLSSTVSGSLHGLGDCVVPQDLAANGGSYRCTYRTFIEGAAGAPPRNDVVALVRDDEANERFLQDEADLFLVAVAPNLQFYKEDALLVDHFERPEEEGQITPGDTLRYTVQIFNTGNGPAQQVLLEDTPDPNSMLISGSVTTTKGTVLLGNDTGDEQIVVLIGELPIGERATVQFDVFIRLGTGTTLLRNQAFVSYGSFTDPSSFNVEGSDDPNTPFLGDPTDTRVLIPPTGIDPEEEPSLTRRYYIPLVQN